MYPNARDVITKDKSKADTVCRLCGRMYTSRPQLCLCASNCFLSPVTEPPKITLEEAKALGWQTKKTGFLCPNHRERMYSCRKNDPSRQAFFCPSCGVLA